MKTTMANKAGLINRTLDIETFEPELTRIAMLEQHPMAWIVAVDGLLVDVRTLPLDLQDEARRRGLLPDLDALAGRRMTTIADLDALIEELTVDAYDDDEQSGFHVGAEERLRRGEPATSRGGRRRDRR